MYNNPSRNPNSGLHEHILDSDSLQGENPYNVIPPDRPSVTVRQNMLRDLQMKIYGSIAFCLSSMAISIFKIIITSSLLSYDKTQCNQPIDDYFIYMMIHDAANCFVLALRLLNILSIFGNRDLQEEDLEGGYRNAFDPEQAGSPNRPRPMISLQNFSHDQITRFSKRMRIINTLFTLTNLYYCFLFVYAHILYFQPESNCSELAPVKNGLMLSYIILGYIFVGLPTISFLLVCFCLPFVILGFYLFKKNPNAATKKMIARLPVTKYSSDLPGDKECSICMTEYKIGDNIVQLKCSPMHYFHEDCIKKWLQINGMCPICRQPIEKDTELQRVNAPAPVLVEADNVQPF